jgi:hypothetical protein
VDAKDATDCEGAQAVERSDVRRGLAWIGYGRHTSP